MAIYRLERARSDWWKIAMVNGVDGSKGRRTIGSLRKSVVERNIANEIGGLVKRSRLVLR